MGSGTPRRSPWRLLKRTCVLGLLTALLLELALRWLLFAPPAALAPISARLRRAELFAAQWEDDYWKLRYVFQGSGRAPMPRRHPLLGWYGPDIDPTTYAHPAADGLQGRRPLLLYGDSFAACVTPAEECWQGLLEDSPLASEYSLLNYGVGGYGLDQTFLMARESLDRYEGQRPLVVIGILIDDDLDRCRLRIRGWPKPYLVQAADGTLVPEEPVAPDDESFLEAHPLTLRSYALRYLVCGSGLLPSSFENRLTGRRGAQESTRERSSIVLEHLAEELAERGVEHFVLLFHGPPEHGTPPGSRRQGGWRETFLVSELERLGLPYVLSSVELAQSSESGLFFDDSSIRRSHYTAAGNRVVFGALLRGIEGRFDRAASR